MNLFIIISSFILGTIIGSFLNVVVLRFNTGKSLGGRSGCFSCGKTLSWFELIPVFSWIFQKGRCRKCQARISPLYILGEFTAGVFFALVAARGLLLHVPLDTPAYLGGTLFLFVLFSLLLIMLWYDIRHKVIPDLFSFLFGALAFVGLFFLDRHAGFVFASFSLPSLWDILAGIMVPLPFVLVWIISKGRWIGLGDPKLMVGMGWLFGIAQGFTAVVLGFWIGALFVFAIMIINVVLKKHLLQTGKKSIMKEELAFAPFLIIATLITLIFDVNLFMLI